MKNEIFRIEYRDVLDVLKDSEKLVKKIEDLLNTTIYNYKNQFSIIFKYTLK